MILDDCVTKLSEVDISSVSSRGDETDENRDRRIALPVRRVVPPKRSAKAMLADRKVNGASSAAV